MAKNDQKVIAFSLGSRFYYQRASYYHDKNNLDKAMVFYRRAIDVDPANPVNHFNLACLLSELGKYQESSKIFRHVLGMDSQFHEAFFWLAMNYGQLKQYKKAKQYLKKYIEAEPEGEYVFQAQDILDYMKSEFPYVSPLQREKIDRLCGAGIGLINQGKLRQALKFFEEACQVEPELMAPKNNLALTWFYLGDTKKAIEISRNITDEEPANVYANCNLALFLLSAGDEVGLTRQIRVLGGLEPGDRDESIKLGTTLGMLGNHRRAWAVLSGLLPGEGGFEVALLQAIAAFNCGHRAESLRLLDRLDSQEPDNPYSSHYRRQIAQGLTGALPYHLRIPEPLLARILEGKPERSALGLKKRPDLWPSLLWMARHGTAVTQDKVLACIRAIDDSNLNSLLVKQIWRRDLQDEAREYLFSALLKAGLSPASQDLWPLQPFSTGQTRVMKGVLEELVQHQKISGFFRAWQLWLGYCKEHNPIIRNPRLWQVALITLVLHGPEGLAKAAADNGLSLEGLAKKMALLHRPFLTHSR